MKMETPPRTWGRQSFGQARKRIKRNTPTHVGKTVPRITHGACRGKHPHARGEDVMSPFYLLMILETPPRTWGRRPAAMEAGITSRNTPTHVGKTS